MREQWRHTIQARSLTPRAMAATALAFAVAVLLAHLSGSIGPAGAVCICHAAAVANGVLGRQAGGDGRDVAGRLLGALTLSLVFTVAVVVASTLVLGTRIDESLPRILAQAVSGSLWMAVLVALLSSVLPRRVDAVVALLVSVAVGAVNANRSQLESPSMVRAVEVAAENFAGAVVLSDALTATAVTDVARWGANMALALLAIAFIARRRQPASGAGLAVAAGIALVARLLVPSVHDRVAWVPAAAGQGTVTASRQPTLYNFTADWCPYCHRLERDLFADGDSARWLGERFVPVRVVDREREDGRNSEEVERLKARFEVTGFPTLVVVSPDGTVLARHEGYGGNLREVRRVLATAIAASPRP